MRRLGLWAALMATLGCPADDGGLSVTINAVQLTADRARPDELADLQLTVEVHAGSATEVTAEEVRAASLPGGEVEVALSPRLLGPQGEVASIEVAKGQTLVLRVLNGNGTNAQVMGLCDRPANVTAVMGADGTDVEDDRDVNVTCRN